MVSNAPFCTAVDISTLGHESHETSQHACTPWCIPVPARHVGYMPTWIESSLAVVIKNIFGPSSDQSFDWTYFRLITVTFAIPTDNRLPPELLLLASWSSELRNSRAVKWKHNDFNSVLADWVCIYYRVYLQLEMHCDLKRKWALFI